MQHISDSELDDVWALASSSRPVPGLIVRAIIQRLRETEAQLAFIDRPPNEAPEPDVAAHALLEIQVVNNGVSYAA